MLLKKVILKKIEAMVDKIEFYQQRKRANSKSRAYYYINKNRKKRSGEIKT